MGSVAQKWRIEVATSVVGTGRRDQIPMIAATKLPAPSGNMLASWAPVHVA